MQHRASTVLRQDSTHCNHNSLTRQGLCTNGSRIASIRIAASPALVTTAWQAYRYQLQQCPATSALISHSRCTVIAAAASNGKGGASRTDEVWDQLIKLADKYLGAGSHLSSKRKSSRHSSLQPPAQAIHILLGAYVVMWVLTSAHITSSGPLLPAKLLSLDHISNTSNWIVKLLLPLTDALLSGSSSSSAGGLILARNLFFGYMFGRVVENTEGSAALWWVFGASAVGGAVASLALLPRRAVLQGCAATAAMFGLFSAATIFNRHKSWHWQRAFELAVLSPFVTQQLLATWHSNMHFCSILGFGLPSTCVPLLGGFVGAATAAGVLAVTRAVQSSIVTQQEQQRLQKKPDFADDSGDASLPTLLARAAAQMLRKSMGL